MSMIVSADAVPLSLPARDCALAPRGRLVSTALGRSVGREGRIAEAGDWRWLCGAQVSAGADISIRRR